MRILSVDTTSVFGSLALLEGGALLEQLPLHSPDGFSQTLFDSVRRLLERHEWEVGSVECFASASGPGSFTGVRVGLTAVKGLAEATGVRAVAVSNLEALAECGSTALRAVVADARRGEVYGALYDADLQVVSPEIVQSFPAWLASLPAGVTEVLSPDLTAFRNSLPGHLLLTEQRTLAAAVGRIAHRRVLAGAASDPAAIDANYVRRADAEMKWEDEPVARTS
jgi:tRNA threonylcarbamoyladenosine biosynthesis protein TsaB